MRAMLRGMLFRALAVLLAVAAALAACESTPLDAPATECQADGDCQAGQTCSQGACKAPAAQAFDQSECGGCVKQVCAGQLSECDRDASCGPYLGCLLACPVQGGHVDADCLAQCPTPTGASALRAQQAFEDCRSAAESTDCPVCSGPGGSGAGGSGAGGAGPGGAGPGGSDAGGMPGGAICDGIPALDETCRPAPNADSCAQCRDERCCQAVDAALLKKPGSDFSSCWSVCDTPQCIADCYAKFPDGVAAFGAFDACMEVDCFGTTACPSVKSCNKCQGSQCGCEYAACATDPDCEAEKACTGACNGDIACAEACAKAHPAGAVKYNALTVCVSQKCIDAC